LVGEFDLQGKTFIEGTYEQMRNANIVKSSEEFSIAFLGKSKSYYRAMKAQNLEANNSLLTNLLNELNTRRELFEHAGGGNIKFHYDRWRGIEREIVEELILRATDRGFINKYALNNALSAVQAMIEQRLY
jgi:hypothetical protein